MIRSEVFVDDYCLFSVTAQMPLVFSVNNGFIPLHIGTESHSRYAIHYLLPAHTAQFQVFESTQYAIKPPPPHLSLM